MNLTFLNFNTCLNSISNVCPIFKTKDYFFVENNELKLISLNFFDRIARYFGRYSETHKDNFLKNVSPLLLTPNAIPEEYVAGLQNLLQRERRFNLLETSQDIEFAGESIEVVHDIDYSPFSLKDNPYTDASGEKTIIQFDLASKPVAFSWSNDKGLFEFSIAKINENTFIFEYIRTLGYPDQEQDDVTRQYEEWVLNQIRAILTTLAFDLRLQDANILYISKERLGQESIDDEKIFIKNILVEFDQQIFRTGEERPYYLYRFKSGDIRENARRINDISLAFSLGFKAAGPLVKSAVN